jgi:hypothetical protein
VVLSHESGHAVKEVVFGDAAEWQPVRAAGRCEVALWVIVVKAKYRLEIRDADRSEFRVLLADCQK